MDSEAYERAALERLPGRALEGQASQGRRTPAFSLSQDVQRMASFCLLPDCPLSIWDGKFSGKIGRFLLVCEKLVKKLSDRRWLI